MKADTNRKTHMAAAEERRRGREGGSEAHYNGCNKNQFYETRMGVGGCDVMAASTYSLTSSKITPPCTTMFTVATVNLLNVYTGHNGNGEGHFRFSFCLSSTSECQSKCPAVAGTF